jgi:hypothetical protein
VDSPLGLVEAVLASGGAEHAGEGSRLHELGIRTPSLRTGDDAKGVSTAAFEGLVFGAAHVEEREEAVRGPQPAEEAAEASRV